MQIRVKTSIKAHRWLGDGGGTPNSFGFKRLTNYYISHFLALTQCLKITDKVSFNIASEASYVYILSGQKLIKNAKNSPF